MSDRESLVDLESRFWRAAGDRDFYRANFADDGIMAFHVGLMTKDEVMAAMGTAGEWDGFTIDDLHYVALAEDVASLTYTTIARSAGSSEEYRAAITSVYALRDREWKLVLHQQTPLTAF